ncbi:MAG: cytochrome-c oxidase, cbb3-type subunit III [Gammaproteobacteria bacterium]|nr:cytochrome-c oxidase, cbb3-type subunit III [Gammaproteobacteria bacterium]MDH4310751.1 cytochrome-c oxidase, cbb3-type subunit III [Gammaproteobacteria bacterium]MDH5271655.1 cytochrome-c oxidase, cbb3-type subunit III [Gammaproteobacteria bacterium]
MTSGWSLFVIILTIANIVACFWMLRWTSKPRTANEKIGGGADTGHVWDKDLREYNNPLPKWWLWLFYITIVFGLLYLAFYPGLGNFAGVGGWTQTGQYEEEKAAVEARAATLLAPLAALPVAELVNNEQAMSTAHNLFQQNCAQCHGSDGGGAVGFPNLRDASWQWGSDADSVVATIAGGRIAAMPPWGAVLGEPGVEEVVAYVQTLSGQQADATKAAAGQARFQTVCSACHGMDGKGNPLLGAPNLTDEIWLYGGDAATIKQTLMDGRNGQMPAWGDKLGEQRVKLLAAYVTKLAAGQ